MCPLTIRYKVRLNIIGGKGAFANIKYYYQYYYTPCATCMFMRNLMDISMIKVTIHACQPFYQSQVFFFVS